MNIEEQTDLTTNLNNKDKSDITVDYNELERLRKNIESLDMSHHIEIAKIFKKNNIKLTENDNGIFINLNMIKNNVIFELKEYLNFIKQQENHINKDEIIKEKLENIYFKDNKDITNNNIEKELDVQT